MNTATLTDDLIQKIMDDLKKPFPLKDMEWKVQSAGVAQNGKIWARVLTYITARAIQDRLDHVVGGENWKNEFAAAPQGGVLCGISLRILGEWITKWNGAENTDIEGVKGGLSNAEKRCASEWGIGRYLYGLETEFAEICENGLYQGSFADKNNNKKRIYFKWNPPVNQIPDWALSESDLQLRKNKVNLLSLMRADAPADIKPENETMTVEKQIANLPTVVIDAFRSLAWTKGQVVVFCLERKWNYDQIAKDIKKLLEG